VLASECSFSKKRTLTLRGVTLQEVVAEAGKRNVEFIAYGFLNTCEQGWAAGQSFKVRVRSNATGC